VKWSIPSQNLSTRVELGLLLSFLLQWILFAVPLGLHVVPLSFLCHGRSSVELRKCILAPAVLYRTAAAALYELFTHGFAFLFCMSFGEDTKPCYVHALLGSNQVLHLLACSMLHP